MAARQFSRFKDNLTICRIDYSIQKAVFPANNSCIIPFEGEGLKLHFEMYVASSKGGPSMKVKEAMHKGVDWVSPDTPVPELARLMRDRDVGAIPIGENDRLVGMVTDRDIVCKGLAQDDFDVRSATARDVMTAEIHCCREDEDLAKAVRHMEELKVRRLPVINKSKRMIGMLSLGDVSHSAPVDLLSECVKSVSAHH
jgi:CBS domain-containing protein